MSAIGYRYRAATASGELVEGVVQAATPRDALDELRRRTLVPVAVEPMLGAATSGSATTSADDRGGVSRARRILGADADALPTAMRTVATMLAGGATLDRALAFAAEHAGTPTLQLALRQLRGDVQRGHTLAQALRANAKVFGPLAPALVRAGEESGTLDDALAQLADHLERTRDLRAQLRAALWYPALMGIVAGSGVLVLLTFVVPRFSAVFATTGSALPLSTRALVAMSHAVSTWWWLFALLVVLALVAWRGWMVSPANRQRWHGGRLRLPMWGELERTIATARFARALGTLLTGGAGVLTAMRVARESVANEALGGQLERASDAVARGEGVAASLAGVLPPLATQLLAVGEESGTLAAMALRVADSADAESHRTLRTLVAMIEPLLIVLFGGVVGFVALAMLQAVYSINISLG